jgi:hypothetical protein
LEEGGGGVVGVFFGFVKGGVGQVELFGWVDELF